MEAPNTYTITLTEWELLTVAGALVRDSHNRWASDEARQEAFRLSKYLLTRIPDGRMEEIMLEM